MNRRYLVTLTYHVRVDALDAADAVNEAERLVEVLGLQYASDTRVEDHGPSEGTYELADNADLNTVAGPIHGPDEDVDQYGEPVPAPTPEEVYASFSNEERLISMLAVAQNRLDKANAKF